MTTKIKIGDRWVGEGEPTYIVAEVGSNHNGDLAQAKELIDVAASSGVDVVKFQIFKAETLLTHDHPAFQIIKDNELPREWVGELASYAEKRDIIFTASPFDHEAVDLLCEIGVPLLKWASPEIHDIPLLKYAAATGKALLVSTGMCNLMDIHHAIEAVRSQGNENFAVLHCVSSYPTETADINLRMMDSIRDAFKVPVGLSDHTTSTVIPAAAVARGACVIEKHFTLSRSLDGPDHSFALEPAELSAMVSAIREVDEGLGSSVKGPVPVVENLAVKYKYLVSDVAIPVGTTITTDMLTVKRGGHGILPVNLEIVVGRKAAEDIPEDKLISWEMV